MVNFVDLFVKAEQFGIRDTLLPFLFVFTLVFAILEKVKILGEKSKRFNFSIALIMGLLFVIPHVTNYYPYGYDPVQIVNDSIPDISLVLIMIFLFFLVVATISGKGADSLLKPDITKFILLLSAIAVVGIFGANAGWWNLGIIQNITDEQVAYVAMALFFVFLIYYVTKGEEGEHKTRVKEKEK